MAGAASDHPRLESGWIEVMSATSSRSSYRSSKSVTGKPWFLTCVNGDVFGWKDGARLKLKSGESAGRVKSIVVLSADDALISVSLFFVSREYFLHPEFDSIS